MPAVRVLTLQVVVNDLSCQSRPPASDEPEAKHILIVVGTLTAEVRPIGPDPNRQAIITARIEPGQAHPFQLGPIGVEIVLEYNNHDPVVVPYVVLSSCGRLRSPYFIALHLKLNSFSHQGTSRSNPPDGGEFIC